MQCAACGTENPADHKFCAQCGTALTVTCPTCGHPNSPSHRFCSECGTALTAAEAPTTAAPEAVAERRLVTVMFADLSGFTAFSETRDSEEVRAVVTRYYDRARELVEQFGGQVDKFIGDAVMAVWGSVTTHEDDAERAVRAALELVDMVRDLAGEIAVSELNLRAGVLTGQTSVGPAPGEERLVIGDLVNTASRLESLAPPGSVLVGESTYRLVRDAIALEPFGVHEVKGKAEPVTAYRVLHVAAQTQGKGRTSGLEAPFVGRSDELRMLKDQLHATGREGRSRLVSIVGEAGIGKSRLIWELQKYIDGLAEPIYWHYGRSPAYGDGVTFWALGEMIRGRAGIAETDDHAKSRMKLRTAVAEYVPAVDDQSWVEPMLAGLLGLADMPSGDRTEMFAALRTLFERISDLGTTVLGFEDMQWADDGLLAFIEDLVDRAASFPILVITAARPDLVERRPGWGSGRRNFLSLHLGPLTDTEMYELVSGMVPGIPDDAAQTIAARSAGVPLYAVEIVRMLVNHDALVAEDGRFRLVGDLADLGIPDTLQAVIGARLDRLEPADRALVQDAAVLGYSFTVGGLAALAGQDAASIEERLRSLVRRELLEYVDDPRSPERGQYRFVQTLIRQVAYGRLSRDERRLRHLRVAEQFSAMDDPEVAAIVATHYLGAVEASMTATDRDDITGLALDALREAAGRARNLHSHGQARALYDRALSLADDQAVRAELLERSTVSIEALGDVEGAVERLREVIAIYTDNKDGGARLRAVTRLGNLFNNNGRSDQAVAALEKDFEKLTDLDDPVRLALASEMGRSLMLVGEDERAAEVSNRVLAAAELAEEPRTIVNSLIDRGTALCNMGRYREGTALLRGAADLAGEVNWLWGKGRALNNLGAVLNSIDPVATFAVLTEVYEVATKVGHPAWIYRITADLSDFHVDMGQYEAARELIDSLDPADMPEEIGMRFPQAAARIELLQGTASDAAQRVRETLATWDSWTDPQVRYTTGAWKARTELEAGNWEQAYQMGMAVEWSFGNHPWHLQVATTAAAALGNVERSRAVAQAFADRTVTGPLSRGLRAYIDATVAAGNGDLEMAAKLFSEAIALWQNRAYPWDVTYLHLACARLLGHDHPLGAETAAAAAEWLRSTGSGGVAAMWDAVLPEVQLFDAVGS